MASLVLTLIISDLIMHFLLFIEKDSKEFTFNIFLALNSIISVPLTNK